MPLFLVTSLIDEGMSSSDFVVVQVTSVEEIAAHVLAHSQSWGRFLRRSYPQEWRHPNESLGGNLWDILHHRSVTPAELLDLISKTHVDGDSWAQLAIHPVHVQSLTEVNLP
jgi:hypothetical protein